MKSRPGKKRDDPPPIAATRGGCLDALREMPPADVRDAVDHNGCGCLHWAAGNGDVALCRFLIEELAIDVHVESWNRRTPLHYAARNGQLAICRWLVLEAGADPDRLARDEVTPFQLAVWQNHLDCCRWLVDDMGVDATQQNKFGCTVAHWLSMVPKERAGRPQGAELLPTADWLRGRNVDFTMTQEHGHTPLHKAAWYGHLELCRWLRDVVGLLDNTQDEAGNYAADLADMNGQVEVAAWLRSECSEARSQSCRVLGVSVDADAAVVRSAYLERVRTTHPDASHRRAGALEVRGSADFDSIQKAYRHLTVEGGRGCQRNSRHLQLPMILDTVPNRVELEPGEVPASEHFSIVVDHQPASGSSDDSESGVTSLFKMRLLTIIREFGTKGFPLSSLRKKYAQVWDGADLPPPSAFGITKKRCGLLELVQTVASDVVRVETFSNGGEPLLHAAQTVATVVAAPPPLPGAHGSCSGRARGSDMVGECDACLREAMTSVANRTAIAVAS